MRWNSDDPHSVERSGVDRHGPYGYAAWDELACLAGARGIEARSPRWRFVYFQGASRRSHKNSLARFPRHVALRQTVGARQVYLAVARRRRCRHYPCAGWLYARRNRLETSAAHLAAASGGVIEDRLL